MLRRSVEALISRRDCHRDRLSQGPCTSFAAPHERQPGVFKRSVVRRPATERSGDAWMRPDITPGELTGRANQCTRDQAEHRQVNLHLSSESALSLCRRSRAVHRASATAIDYDAKSQARSSNLPLESDEIGITVIDEPIEGATPRSRIGIGFHDPLNLPWAPLYRERSLFFSPREACAFPSTRRGRQERVSARPSSGAILTLRTGKSRKVRHFSLNTTGSKRNNHTSPKR